MREIETEYQPATDDLKFAVQIMAGLLATGHYTEIYEDGEVEPRKWDAGEDWKEAFTRRFHYRVVMDATDLLKALKAEMNPNADSNQTKTKEPVDSISRDNIETASHMGKNPAAVTLG